MYESRACAELQESIGAIPDFNLRCAVNLGLRAYRERIEEVTAEVWRAKCRELLIAERNYKLELHAPVRSRYGEQARDRRVERARAHVEALEKELGL